MDRAKIKNTIIDIQNGDVVNLVVDAIVSPDSTDFFMSKGPARGIAKASSVRLRQEYNLDHPVKTGEVLVTSAGTLPAKHILHTAIMEPDAIELDRAEVVNAIANFLETADKRNFQTVGVPVFGSSTAVFSYETCAKVMINGIFNYFSGHESNIKMVTIAVFDKKALEPFLKVFKSFREIYQI